MTPIIGLFQILYISIMFKLCHPDNLSESRYIYVINGSNWHRHDASYGERTFSTRDMNDFSLMKIIKDSLFVVTKNTSIVELKVESLKVTKLYESDYCQQPNECIDHKITVISSIELFKTEMMYFCFTFQDISSMSKCKIPKNSILMDSLHWIKTGFSSTSPTHETLVVKTTSHLFIGSFTDKSLSILRTKFPDEYGKIDSSDDLVTPIAPFYFEKQSAFLEGFEVNEEIYFLVTEMVSSRTSNTEDCSEEVNVLKTRIIRICKNDPGGVVGHNKNNFGTIAKADIVCSIGADAYRNTLTNAISASWAKNKLYVLFKSQRFNGNNVVLCVYDTFAFNMAFNGDMRTPWISLNTNQVCEKQKNPLPNVCMRLFNHELSEEENITASSLSVNGLYRSGNVHPITNGPLVDFKNEGYEQVKVFQFHDDTLVVLFKSNIMKILIHTDAGELCHIHTHHLFESESVRQAGFTIQNSKMLLIVSTNIRILQLNLNICEKFSTDKSCLSDAPHICGWDTRLSACSPITHFYEKRHYKRSKCKTVEITQIWSDPVKCQINEGNLILTCLCTYCINQEKCLTSKVEVNWCSGRIDKGQWGTWARWTSCHDGFQNRVRTCISNEKCFGSSTEKRACKPDHSGKIDEPSQTIDGRVQTNAPIEPWTQWSTCTNSGVMYRLLNCSSVKTCPESNIQIRLCSTIQPSQVRGPLDNQSQYTVIHLVLTVLVASIIWLFILIIIIIVLLKSKFKKHTIQMQKEFHRRHRTNSGIDPRYFRNYSKQIVSETSNDYLSSDYITNSVNNNPDVFSSLPSNITSQLTVHSPIPLISD